MNLNPEHEYCANRGLCDFSSGLCVCYADFKGVDCHQPSNIPDSIDDNDGFLVNPQGLTYVGSVLHLETTKGSASDFNFIFIESSTYPILTMNGFGDTKLLQGNMEISTGSLRVEAGATITTLGLNVVDGGATITSTSTTDTTVDIVNSNTGFTGSALRVQTAEAASTQFMLFEAKMSGITTAMVDIRGDGLTTIHSGGLFVQTGGATVHDNQAAASVLAVENINGAFTGPLFALDTVTASQYPSTDFVLIDANANGIDAFTVETSGKTTIANGGLVVNGVGGGKIYNSDPAAEALLVNPTALAFAGDALSIQTPSSQAHNLFKAIAGGVTMVTIDDTGLTTINHGGLKVMSGGATVYAGGLYVTSMEQTIEAGGLHIIDGGETIDAGGLTVQDGGAAITTLSDSQDALVVAAPSTAYTGSVLHVTATTPTPLDTGYYLLKADGATGELFSVLGTGKTTVSQGGLLVSAGGATITAGGLFVNADGAYVAGGLTVNDGGVTVSSGNVNIMETTSSTDSTTGALTVAGGAGIGENAYVAGLLKVELTTDSTASTDGALIVAGGAGIAKSLHIGGTTGSTSSANGALTVAGGVGIAKDVFTGGKITAATGFVATTGGLTVTAGGATVTAGDVTMGSTTQSTASTIGALVVSGGVGIAKDVYGGGKMTVGSTTDSTSTGTGALIVGGGVGITGSITVGGAIKITSSTTSSDSSTGSLVVMGGAGIADNVNVGGYIKTASTTDSTSTTTGSLIVGGGAGIAGSVTVGGAVKITSSTATSSSTFGAFVVTGGVGIGGDIRCAGTSYAVAHSSTSDSRMKTEIQDLPSPQSLLSYLHPVSRFVLCCWCRPVACTWRAAPHSLLYPLA